MVTAAGSSSTTAVVNSVLSGSEIQWTQTAAGALIQWISGRVPAGGVTLTTSDISIWAHENAMNVDSGGRYRIFRRNVDETEEEITAVPHDDLVEFGQDTPSEMTWVGNFPDTAFAEDTRVLLKIYIVPVGTMGSGTCTLTYNAADAATGDSFLNLAETVTFKAEDFTAAEAVPSFPQQWRPHYPKSRVVAYLTPLWLATIPVINCRSRTPRRRTTGIFRRQESCKCRTDMPRYPRQRVVRQKLSLILPGEPECECTYAISSSVRAELLPT